MRVARLRAALSRFAEQAVPRRLDLLLFQLLLSEPSDMGRVGGLEPGWQMMHYTASGEPSGDPYIDLRLSPLRECYAIRIDGRVAHVSWVHLRAHLPRRCGFLDAPVIGDAATRPDARGRGLFAVVLRQIASDLAARGVPAVQGLVRPDNSASIRSFEHAGFTRLARIRGLWVGGMLFGKSVS
jgi:GNAT superfamily N-acetyltransferase